VLRLLTAMKLLHVYLLFSNEITAMLVLLTHITGIDNGLYFEVSIYFFLFAQRTSAVITFRIAVWYQTITVFEYLFVVMVPSSVEETLVHTSRTTKSSEVQLADATQLPSTSASAGIHENITQWPSTSSMVDLEEAAVSDLELTTPLPSTKSSLAAGVSQVPVTSITADSFPNTFVVASSLALKAIVDDHVLSVADSVHGSRLVAVAQTLLQHSTSVVQCCPFIFSSFKDLFVNKNFISASDKDCLTVKVQQLRLAKPALTEFTTFVLSHEPSADEQIIKMLHQVWLRHMINELLLVIVDLNHFVSPVATLPQPLTYNDQCILYYVSGYLARKLCAACLRHRNLKSLFTFAQTLSSKGAESGHFVDSFNRWVSKQSRGGLLFPKPNFYLFVRELDSMYRQGQQTAGTTLESRIAIQSRMLESFMANYYWMKLVKQAEANAADTNPALHYIVSLFITVKGFAVAKKERQKLSLGPGKTVTEPKSKSLRGGLKKKSELT